MKKLARRIDNRKEDRRLLCLELACRWPQTLIQSGSPYVAGGGGLGGVSSSYIDADVIGRARKLEAYLTE